MAYNMLSVFKIFIRGATKVILVVLPLNRATIVLDSKTSFRVEIFQGILIDSSFVLDSSSLINFGLLPVIHDLAIIPIANAIFSATSALVVRPAVISTSVAEVPLVSSAMIPGPNSPRIETRSRVCALSAAAIIDGSSARSGLLTIQLSVILQWKLLLQIVLTIVFSIKANKWLIQL